ncbi:MAG: hypothetical protein AAFS10_12560, partial [Myxococcota bacterium]
NTLSQGLQGIVLGNGAKYCYGWYNEGLLAINAWSRAIVEVWYRAFFDDHRVILDRLMIPYEFDDARPGDVIVHFTPKTAGAFLLTHVFLHELGHHTDRMGSRRQAHLSRGEDYAEHFALDMADMIWDDFFRAFHI